MNKRQAKGLCRKCVKKCKEGRALCEGHLALQAEWAKFQRRRRAKLGLCEESGCEERRLRPHVVCSEHLEKRRAYQREYVAGKRRME